MNIRQKEGEAPPYPPFGVQEVSQKALEPLFFDTDQ